MNNDGTTPVGQPQQLNDGFNLDLTNNNNNNTQQPPLLMTEQEDLTFQSHKRGRGEHYTAAAAAENTTTILISPQRKLQQTPRIIPRQGNGITTAIPNLFPGLEQAATLDISRAFNDDDNWDDDDETKDANNEIQLPFVGNADGTEDVDMDYPQARLKRFHPQTGAQQGNDDEMVQLEEDFEYSHNGSHNDGEFDREFLDLLKEFASLELPQYYSQTENCPLCSKEFKTEEFATHVYSCITCLDDVEKQQCEDMDAMLAAQLAMDEVESFDFLHYMQQKTGFSEEDAQIAAMIEVSEQQDGGMGGNNGSNDSMGADSDVGLSYVERNKKKLERLLANQALAFNQYKYRGTANTAPSVQAIVAEAECCVCGLMVPKVEIDGHVLGCLNSPPKYRLGPGRKANGAAAANTMGEDNDNNDNGMGDNNGAPRLTTTRSSSMGSPRLQQQQQQQQQQHQQQQSITTATRPQVPQFRDTNNEDDDEDGNRTNGMDNDPFQVNDAEDEERDLRRRDELIRLNQLQQQAENGTLTQSDLMRLPTEQREAILPLTNANNYSNNNNQQDGLNAQQIGLIARMIHDTTTSYSTNSSINSLLTTFQALGLNKSSLKRAKDELTRNELTRNASATTMGNNNVATARAPAQSTSTPITPTNPPLILANPLDPLTLNRTRSQDAATATLLALDSFTPNRNHIDLFGNGNNQSEMDDSIIDAKSHAIIASSEFPPGNDQDMNNNNNR